MDSADPNLACYAAAPEKSAASLTAVTFRLIECQMALCEFVLIEVGVGGCNDQHPHYRYSLHRAILSPAMPKKESGNSPGVVMEGCYTGG